MGEHALAVGLVQQVVGQMVVDVCAHQVGGGLADEALAARRHHEPVGGGVQHQRGYRPLFGACKHRFARVEQKLREARRELLVQQRVGFDLVQHLGVGRDPFVAKASRHGQVRHQSTERRQQRALGDAHGGLQRRCGQDRAVQRASPRFARLGRRQRATQAGRNGSAHARPEHDARPVGVGAGDGVVEQGLVVQQIVCMLERAAWAFGAAVSAVVDGGGGPAGLVQQAGQFVEAPGMFAHAMDQLHRAIGSIDGPVMHVQPGAVVGAQRAGQGLIG